MSQELEQLREGSHESHEAELPALNRRRFLEMFGVGAGAVVVLSSLPTEAHSAVPAVESPTAAADPTDEGRIGDVNDGDSDDPVERVQYWRRRRRRWWRRRRRRWWRRRYWLYRRRRRRWWWRRRRRWWRRRRRVIVY